MMEWMNRCWKHLGFALLILPLVGFEAPIPDKSSGKQVTTAISLNAWRKLDTKGQACSSCHSPDGLELAVYNFSDSDILRRAQNHLPDADAEQILVQIHELRKAFHIEAELDPMKDRPLQPGGEVLDGATPMVRDKRFSENLRDQLPTLFGPPIRSLDEAAKARDEVLGINLTQLKIGIPFNRLSEDVAHGSEHASIATWISDVKLERDVPHELEDVYIADPSAKNYQAIESFLTNPDNRPSSPAQAIGLNKKRSLLYFQHVMRMKLTGKKLDIQPARLNPMWDLGERARLDGHLSMDRLGLPDDVAAKKKAGPSYFDQLHDLRLPWYWLGWMFDPSLERISGLGESIRGDYFSRYLTTDGPYPMHSAFMITRKIVEESFAPSAWTVQVPQHLKIYYSTFTDDNGFNTMLPTDPEHRQLFENFAKNSFRMNLYLELAELKKTNTIYQRPMLIQQIRRMKVVFTDPEDQALADQVLSAIAKGKDGARMGKGT